MDSTPSSNGSFIPAAAMDLLLAFPRLAQRAGSLAFFHMPEAMDNIAGKIWNGGSIIADATGRTMANNSTITDTSAAVAQSTAAAAAFDGALKDALREGGVAIGGGPAGEASTSVIAMTVQFVGRLKNFGGIFSYLTSRWALATFSAAIILNRTQFYASSREHLRLRWHVRLMLYSIPLAGFLSQLFNFLQALRCQTSPDFALLRYGDPLKRLAIDFGGDGGFLYWLSSSLLFWQDDATCCAARHMSIVALGEDKSELRGSMSLLFFFFGALCISQLFETLACALEGRQPMPETGMTLFEHSLAFAECEAMISSALGFGFFGSSKSDSAKSAPGEATSILVSRNEVLRRLNVPPEVLLVCLISCLSHLSSALLAISGFRHKVRLVNTGIWAFCYMAAFIWSFAKIFWNPIESIADLGVLRFPTVCIVGFIPHVLILIGITICGTIYGLALLLTALSVPEEISRGMSFRQCLSWAYRNLQANVHFSPNSNIRLKMSEDFYTTLLKIGFSILTAASEAVYLNEGSRIQVAQMTWLEQKRIDELADNLEKRKTPAIPAELLGEGIAKGVEFSDHQHATISFSPYARERRSKPAQGGQESSHSNDLDTGLGLTTRRNRMQLTFDFIAGMFWLIVGLSAQIVMHALRRLSIERRPTWLLKAAGITERRQGSSHHDRPVASQERDFLITDSDGHSVRPLTNLVDVEIETRRMWAQSGEPLDEETLSGKLYAWWRTGGWFGELDDSGDFPDAVGDDDDTTSMISMSTNASVMDGDDTSVVSMPTKLNTLEDEWEGGESGRMTPTQENPWVDFSREATPAFDDGLDTITLSRLLDPQSAAEREEARILSHSLLADRPMTRSRYRRDQDHNRAQLLAGLRGSTEGQRSEEEEERELEQFILAQRSKGKAKASSKSASTWESGAEGMGDGGPQCVVCQSTPRTILVWPCGCLSMCDDCRIGLAARNYTKCICCRTEVAAYSRLYVP